MGNSRVKDRFELALDGKQVIALGVGITVLVAGIFVLGMNLGRRSMVAAATIVAPRDPLARLDDPLPVREEAVELKAHQALTDARPIDKSLPVPQVKATTVAIAPPAAPVRPERSVQTDRPVRVDRPVRMESKGAGAESKGGYAIQIASLPTRSDAEKVARKNDARNPRIVTADIPGKGRYYRVVVGSFETQDAAKRQLAVLTRAGIQGIVTAVR